MPAGLPRACAGPRECVHGRPRGKVGTHRGRPRRPRPPGGSEVVAGRGPAVYKSLRDAEALVEICRRSLGHDHDPRATRNISDALWRALVAHDKHCTEPGCTVPPGYCDAHHIWYWSRGGPTNLANLKLGCRQHHRQWRLHDAKKRE
jgi:hypothetical protein